MWLDILLFRGIGCLSLVKKYRKIAFRLKILFIFHRNYQILQIEQLIYSFEMEAKPLPYESIEERMNRLATNKANAQEILQDLQQEKQGSDTRDQLMQKYRKKYVKENVEQISNNEHYRVLHISPNFRVDKLSYNKSSEILKSIGSPRRIGIFKNMKNIEEERQKNCGYLYHRNSAKRINYPQQILEEDAPVISQNEGGNLKSEILTGRKRRLSTDNNLSRIQKYPKSDEIESSSATCISSIKSDTNNKLHQRREPGKIYKNSG